MPTNAVRVEIYRSFIEDGRAPSPIELSHRLAMSPGDVEEALRELDGQDVIALVPGTSFVWLAHPFSALDAPFRVKSDGMAWDAICIWDALGVLALTERPGSVETSCPDCGDPLSLDVSDGEIEPSSHVVHFEVPAARWYEDIGHT